MAEARILNVNDEDAPRYLITRSLERAGFEVVETQTGRHALELVRQRPDLVVLDVKLPDVSGFEVCRQIKANPETRSISVLQVSATYVASENRVRGLDGGADAYLSQPIDSDELVATVRALLRLRKAEEEARRLSDQWQITFDAISDPVFLTDAEGGIRRCNEAGELLLGAPCAQLIGKSFAELLEKLGADAERVGQAHAGGEARLDLQLRDRWFRASMDPIVQAGSRSASVWVLSDMTARRQLEEDLRRTNEQLHQADGRKDEFLAVLAHELRNPLAAISAGIQMLERLRHEDDRAARMRAMVRRQVKQLSRLVDDLLDVSRITRGKIQLRRERVELVGVLRQVVQTNKATFDARNHAVSFDLPSEAIWLEADPVRLEQVFTNLLDNAAKYTDPGGQITVSAVVDERSVSVRVTDNGIGIPAQLGDRIFDMFAQAEPGADRSRGGLGIGLTLVRTLVHMHHGTVTASSEGPGKGSIFTVTLPTQSAPGGVADPTAAPTVKQARRVLLVEDNPDARDALREILEDSGHFVDVATDGQSGIERALASKPDIALIDIGLPGLDGYEVARRIRAGDGKELFLVALTGYSGSQQRQEALTAGFNLHLVKPVDPGELMKVLDRIPGRV